MDSTSPHLSIGFGGWSITTPASRTPKGYGTSTLSHYGDTWREHLNKLDADAIAIDLTAVGVDPTAELVTFSIKGPMADSDVPEGMRKSWDGIESIDWDKYPDFGAGSLDYVNHKDHARMAKKIGARVFNPHTDEDINL